MKLFILVKTCSKFWNLLKAKSTMQHKDFTLCGGIKVKPFLNGDFKMLDLVMGHQISASYPSMKDLFTINSFKTQGGTFHTLKNCEIELREISDFRQNFVANVVDDRVETVNKTEKHLFGIIGTSIIPITSLSNIVPPVYHFEYCFEVV